MMKLPERALAAAVTWLVLWSGAACVRWGFDSRFTRSDAGREWGVGGPEGGPPPEGPASTDLSPNDGALDSDTTIARDQRGPDIVPNVDAALDGKMPDAPGPDMIPHGLDFSEGPLPDAWFGCGPNASADGLYAWNKFIFPLFVCRSTIGPVTQCEASSLCGGSMKLVSPNLFLSQGGAVTYSGPNAWLAGCTERRNARYAAVSANACAVCDGGTVADLAPVTWDCTTGDPILDSNATNLGVHSSPTCAVIGATNGEPANWSASPPDTLLEAAICGLY